MYLIYGCMQSTLIEYMDVCNQPNVLSSMSMEDTIKCIQFISGTTHNYTITCHMQKWGLVTAMQSEHSGYCKSVLLF